MQHSTVFNSRWKLFPILVTFLVLGTGIATANISLCLSNGTTTAYRIYITDLTCADITIGPIIRECTDYGIVGGGTGTGGAVIVDLHPAFDGQPILGSGAFAGTVDLGGTVLSGFLVTRALGATNAILQVLAFDAAGAIYLAEFTATGADLSVLGDLMIIGTPGGQEIPGTFDITGRGTVATGSLTVTVDVIDRLDNTTILQTHHTEVQFGLLTWTFFGNPVANETMSWGDVKSLY